MGDMLPKQGASTWCSLVQPQKTHFMGQFGGLDFIRLCWIGAQSDNKSLRLLLSSAERAFICHNFQVNLTSFENVMAKTVGGTPTWPLYMHPSVSPHLLGASTQPFAWFARLCAPPNIFVWQSCMAWLANVVHKPLVVWKAWNAWFGGSMFGTLLGNVLDFGVMPLCVEMAHMHDIVLGCTC